MSFHSMQADWQALQPMHFETSISFATSASRVGRDVGRRHGGRAADDVETAEMWSWLVLPHATGPLRCGSISTRNALNSGVSLLASPTYGVSEFGPKPLRADAREAPVERHADDVDGLAVDQSAA